MKKIQRFNSVLILKFAFSFSVQPSGITTEHTRTPITISVTSKALCFCYYIIRGVNPSLTSSLATYTYHFIDQKNRGQGRWTQTVPAKFLPKIKDSPKHFARRNSIGFTHRIIWAFKIDVILYTQSHQSHRRSIFCVMSEALFYKHAMENITFTW